MNHNHHYEYDSNNNLIHEIDKYGLEKWYEYDDNHNIIYEKYHTKRYHQNYSSYEKGDIVEAWYRYDSHNNRIYLNFNGSYKKRTITDFYENGQLKQYGEKMFLPNFFYEGNTKSEFYNY